MYHSYCWEQAEKPTKFWSRYNLILIIMAYKVVPFHLSKNVSSELQSIIDIESVNGYKYVNHQYSDKLKPGSAGCFGFGATPDTIIHVGFVVFEKKD